MRLGLVEFDETVQEQSFVEATEVLRWLKDAGLDFVDVGVALSTPTEHVPWGPNFMVPHAGRVRTETGLPVGTSWMYHQRHESGRVCSRRQAQSGLSRTPVARESALAVSRGP